MIAELNERGFAMIEGPVGADPEAVSSAYDRAFAGAAEAQIRRGSTTTRLTGLIATDPFYRIYLHDRLLRLALERIGGPLKLSSFCARTLRAHTPAPPLHQDVQPGSDGDPLVAFIFMVDSFTVENGATRLVPGSRNAPEPPPGAIEHHACGPAGSLLVFDGATWHEHGANRTDHPRRSVQGYFVRKDHAAAESWASRLGPEQVKALPAEARDVLDL